MRLIDADQLISDIQSHNDMEENNPTWRSKDVVMLLENAPEPPNDPLTLEELREMDGKPVPVWCDKVNGYIFIAATKTEPYNQVWFFNHKGHWDTVLYYHTKFYRRKPEEGTS